MVLLPLLLVTAGGLVVRPGELAAASSNDTSALSNDTLGCCPPGSDAGLLQVRDGGPSARHARHRELGQWQWMIGVTAALLALGLALVQAVVFFAPVFPRDERRGERTRVKRKSCLGRRPDSRCAEDSSGSLASASEAVSTRSLRCVSERSLLMGHCAAVTLCPELVVPDSCTLQCGIPEAVCHKRQNLVVSVHGLTVPRGTALFQARLAEGDSADISGVGIHLETLGGCKKFAFLSTQEVWAVPRECHPEMEISKASGEKFATISKTESGTYAITRGTDALMVFSGNFSKHEGQVYSARGPKVGMVGPGSAEGMYEVTVFSNEDAGLVILGLLAIDKMEIVSTKA